MRKHPKKFDPLFTNMMMFRGRGGCILDTSDPMSQEAVPER